MLGTTRQTLSSLLNSLSREGVIELRGKAGLYVPDPERLHHVPGAWDDPKRIRRQRRKRPVQENSCDSENKG
ncbi:helix-turn-helix domain-containing protein [Fundidesulfovibrio agrisoli]|uniref:helix-turn-helix domain-containing protein n=1 Tax=Fundidesulfovibrio agrisoli TaxID=2922717 RepID=UPI003C2BC9BC